jgi:hypothetical protein
MIEGKCMAFILRIEETLNTGAVASSKTAAIICKLSSHH